MMDLPSRLLDDATCAAHLHFVRRLARSLVRGEVAADDLVQETFATALATPPPEGFEWRAWFAGVARRLSWRMLRSEERRTTHERAGGGLAHDGSPAAAETAALLELSRRVVEELHRLGEPYATTLRRRFLDGLDAHAIARLEGVPVETVRTRVKRGLAQLRARLDAAHGGQRQAWAGVFGPWIGGTAMLVKQKAAIAAAAAVLIVAGGIGWRQLALERVPDRVDATAVVAPGGAVDDAGGAPATPVAPDGAPASAAAMRGPAAEPVPAATDPIGIVLQGRVIHPAGVPFERLRARIDAEAPQFESRWVSGDVAGAFAVVGLAPGRWRVQVRDVEGCEPLDQWVEIAATPAVQCVELPLEPSVLVPIRLVTLDGRRLFEALDPERRQWVSRALAVRATAEPPRRELAPTTLSSSRPNDGRGFWAADATLDLGREPRRLEVPDGCDGLLAVGSLPVHVGAYFKHLLLDSAPAQSADEPVELVIEPDAIEELHSTVVVRFVDAGSGAPVPGGRTELNDRQTGSSGVVADADGVVRFERVMPGLLNLQRWHDRHAAISRFVRVDAGVELDLGDVALHDAIAIEGRVVDEAGRPVEHATIQWFLLDAMTPDQPIESSGAQPSDRDGRFTLYGAPQSRLLLTGELRVGGVRRVIGPEVVDATNGPPDDLTLLARETTGLRVALGDTAGELAAVRVERSDGLGLDWALVEGPVSWSRPLPPGSWRFTVASERRGRLVREVTVADDPVVVALSFDETSAARPAGALASHPCGAAGTVAAAHAARATASDATTLLLYGSVVDETGRPVGSKSVRAVDEAGRNHPGDAGASGAYAIPGLPPGECVIELEADGFVRWRELVALDPDQPFVRRDVVLQRKLEIPVRFVAPDGRPLHEAVARTPAAPSPVSGGPLTILLTREPHAVTHPSGRDPRRSSEGGRFVLARSPGRRSFDGTLEVEGALPVRASILFDRRLLQAIEITEPRDELVVTIDPADLVESLASVSWRVVDAITGEPVALTFVTLGRAGGESGSDGARFMQPDGSFRVGGLEPGEFRLGLQGLHHPHVRMRLLLEPGEQRDLGTIRLPGAARVRGRFVDERGEPVRVSYGVRTTGPLPGSDLPYGYTGGEAKEGDFELAAGCVPLRIMVKDNSWAWQSTFVDPTRGPVEDLVIPLAKGTRVSLAIAAAGWRQFEAEIRDDSGDPVGTTWLEGRMPQRFALRPGRYSVVVNEDGAERGTHELVVGDEPVACTIDLDQSR